MLPYTATLPTKVQRAASRAALRHVRSLQRPQHHACKCAISSPHVIAIANDYQFDCACAIDNSHASTPTIHNQTSTLQLQPRVSLQLSLQLQRQTLLQRQTQLPTATIVALPATATTTERYAIEACISITKLRRSRFEMLTSWFVRTSSTTHAGRAASRFS